MLSLLQKGDLASHCRMLTTAIPSNIDLLRCRNGPGSQPEAKRCPPPTPNSRKGERWLAPNTKTAVLNRETGLKPLSIINLLLLTRGISIIVLGSLPALVEVVTCYRSAICTKTCILFEKNNILFTGDTCSYSMISSTQRTATLLHTIQLQLQWPAVHKHSSQTPNIHKRCRKH